MVCRDATNSRMGGVRFEVLLHKHDMTAQTSRAFERMAYFKKLCIILAQQYLVCSSHIPDLVALRAASCCTYISCLISCHTASCCLAPSRIPGPPTELCKNQLYNSFYLSFTVFFFYGELALLIRLNSFEVPGPVNRVGINVRSHDLLFTVALSSYSHNERVFLHIT